MNTAMRHETGFYPAVEPADFPAPDGRWLARLPVVVGVVTGLTMWVVTVAGVLYAA